MNRPDFSLAIRVIGDSLRVTEVTSILGCEPTDAREKGQAVSTSHFTTSAPTGVWSVKRLAHDGDLNSAIIDLLSEMTSDTQKWSNLASRFRVDLFCGVFMRSLNQGFSISPKSMNALSIREITLSFDLYGCDQSSIT
jgi:hypothetical protein